MMNEAIGNALPMAVGVAISPVPIIAIVLMLGTPRARTVGPAFGTGWLAGLAVAGTAMLLIAGGSATQASGEPATWVSVLGFVLGLGFLVLAARTWLGRPRKGEIAGMPKWMRTIDSFTPGRGLAAGAVLAGVNPKNLALTIGAAAAIAQTDVPGGQQAVALATFVVLGSLTILTPLAIYLLMGRRAAEILDGLKTWLSAHNAPIMTVLLLVLGAILIGDAISGLGS